MVGFNMLWVRPGSFAMEQIRRSARTTTSSSASPSVSSSLFLDSPLSLGFTTRRSCPSAATGVKFEVKKIKKEEKEAVAKGTNPLKKEIESK